MRNIDIHAHISPEPFITAMKAGENWHGITEDVVASHVHNPRTVWTPDERLADMNSWGADIHVLSTNATFYQYNREASKTAAMHRDCNDYVAGLVKQYPTRFSGLATIPMQDPEAAAAELERSVKELGLKGAMIGDHVNGKTYDNPEFRPVWKVAEEVGAVLLIHQGGDTIVSPRLDDYHLSNAIGNLADRTVTFASFVFGGVMDEFPDLRVCLSHGGGYVCNGIGRMDRVWEVRTEARANNTRKPSEYLRNFYYDNLTHSEPALRYLIDTVGVDKVLFGTDWPFDMCTDWPISDLLNMESITMEEKEAILYKNLEELLGL
jgi:aminocarboxymuconate-semialdehyde decarboxylase